MYLSPILTPQVNKSVGEQYWVRIHQPLKHSLLVANNFLFSHSVFKRLVPHTRKSQSLFLAKRYLEMNYSSETALNF